MDSVSDRNTGFFRERHLSFRNKLSNNDVNSFGSLSNDRERFEYFNALPLASSYDVPRPSSEGKSSSGAKLLKDDGNKAFQSGQYRIALDLYNRSLVKCPVGSEDGLTSIIRANRSAALYHLKEYKLALNDIDSATKLGYPKELQHKIKDRKAQCLLALKQHESALLAFRETLTALDDAKMPTPQRQKKQSDVQIMMAMLTKNVPKNAPMAQTKEGRQEVEKCNQLYKAASDAVMIKQAEVVGRFAEAKRTIRIGEVVVTENPHCAVLLEQYAMTNCFECFRVVTVVEPCPNCSRVVFCSGKCLKKAMSTHHKFECSILPILWASGASVTCLMALRIVSQKPLNYFDHRFVEDFNEATRTKVYDGSDYSTVYNLVRHQDLRSVEDFLHRAHMAFFLFQCLKASGYFNTKETTNEEESRRRENLIGSLLLRNLQILQFNAHEVSELQIEKSVDKSKSVFLGGAVYPTLALFNHSCNPSVVRYFQGTRVVARAVKTIRKGEMIAENYGPIFTQKRKPERQQTLKTQYWFECRCQPCTENWPVFDEMDTGVLRFRCEQDKCENVITVPIDTMEFMIKCDICDNHINILKGLKLLQDTETTFRLARSLKEEGKFEQALARFLDLLRLLDKTLYPPFKDYHICQQEIRTCYLALGNRKEILQNK